MMVHIELFAGDRNSVQANSLPNLNPKHLWSDVEVDKGMIYPNWEDYKETALEARNNYNFNFRAIMNQFGNNNESQALSGCIFLSLFPLCGYYF